MNEKEVYLYLVVLTVYDKYSEDYYKNNNGVFSTQELAESYCKRAIKTPEILFKDGQNEYCDIDEFEYLEVVKFKLNVSGFGEPVSSFRFNEEEE